MNKLYDVLRLLFVHPRLTHRTIAASLSVSRRTVDRYANLVRASGHSWAALKDKATKELDLLFNRQHRVSQKVRPDFDAIDKALEQRGTTVYHVWSDYRAALRDKAFGYAHFAALYRDYRKKHAVAMRRNHVPGQEVLTDFSGKRPVYIDRESGEPVPVELFIGVLGASNYIYATCVPSQTVPDWVDAHTRMVEFFGGAPAIVVPDNLRSAVSKSGREPVIQRTYAEWAMHYGLAVLPARPGRPRDKGAVEGAVLIVQRAMLPELDRQTFFSIDEVNAAVAKLLVELNDRPFQKRPGCRREVFEMVEKPALQPLPAARFTYGQWMARQVVPKDYHVAVLGHSYSVPHTQVGERVEARVSPTSVEIYADRECVATHKRSSVRGGTSTQRDHQPEAHRAEADRTPDGLLAWADGIGPHTRAYMARQFSGKNRWSGLSAGTVIRNLEQSYTAAELEAAAERAASLHLKSATDLKQQLVAMKGQPAPELRGAKTRAVPLLAPPRARKAKSTTTASSIGGAP